MSTVAPSATVIVADAIRVQRLERTVRNLVHSASSTRTKSPPAGRRGRHGGGHRVCVAPVDREPQRAFGGDRRDHVDREPLPGVAHDRGPPDRGPGGAGVVVRANPGLVAEVDGGTRLQRLIADRRVALALEPLDRLGVLLIGPMQRPLRRQADGQGLPSFRVVHVRLPGHASITLCGPQACVPAGWLR